MITSLRQSTREKIYGIYQVAPQIVRWQQTLSLTHYGRKAGKPYSVTIWFIVNGDKIYLARE
jgi:hypothetical protein